MSNTGDSSVKQARAVAILEELHAGIRKGIEGLARAQDDGGEERLLPLSPNSAKLRTAMRYLVELSLTADAQCLGDAAADLSHQRVTFWRCADAMKGELPDPDPFEEELGPCPVDDPSEHEERQDIRKIAVVGAAARLEGLIRDVLTSLQDAEAPDVPFTPTPADRDILQALAEAPATMVQVDIESASGAPIRTVKDRLRILEDAGLVHRPHGDRKGYALTSRGRAAAPSVR